MEHAKRPGTPFAVLSVPAGTGILSFLMLVMAINGLFLGILLLPVFPLFALGWLAAERLRLEVPRRAEAPRARRAAPVVASARPPAAAQPAIVPAGMVAAEAILAPVTIRVATASGRCPMGYRFEVGTEYVFRNGNVSPAVCPVARRALTPLVAQVRKGEIPATLQPFCKTSVHEVVFEFAAGAPTAREVERVPS